MLEILRGFGFPIRATSSTPSRDRPRWSRNSLWWGRSSRFPALSRGSGIRRAGELFWRCSGEAHDRNRLTRLDAGDCARGSDRDEEGGPPNEPANLVHVLTSVAAQRGVKPDRMAEIVWGTVAVSFRNERGMTGQSPGVDASGVRCRLKAQSGFGLCWQSIVLEEVSCHVLRPDYFAYVLFMLPALILAGVATILTKTRFANTPTTRPHRELRGRRRQECCWIAKAFRVSRSRKSAVLSDHYDPRSRTLRLSPDVYSSPSLSAIGVACHEAGHAMQHSSGYALLGMRSALVPAAQIGSYATYFLFPLGLWMQSPGLIKLGFCSSRRWWPFPS